MYGAAMVRAHDVDETVDALKIASAVAGVAGVAGVAEETAPCPR